METYSFVNIFETKGQEYILVIFFLVLFVIFVRYLGLAGKGKGRSPSKSPAPDRHSPAE